jgi:hypothetical protein
MPLLDTQTSTLLIAVITSVLLPLVISLLKNPNWKPGTKKGFAIGFSILASTGILFAENKLDIQNIILSVCLIIMAAQGNYKLWFEGSQTDRWLTNILALPKTEEITENDFQI